MGSRKRVFKVASALVAIGALLGAGLQPASGYPRPGVTELVSVASDGTQADWLPVVDSCNQVVQAVNRSSDLSASGRYVAFYSSASNLVPGDSNTECDVFRRDRTAGKTERVSVASDGSQALLWGSALPSISATGRYVAFVSAAPNLVPGDTNLSDDIFVHDTKNRATTRVSVASDGTQANSRSGTPSISANGRYVAFHSQADNLVENDANGFPLDVFVHDRKTKETVKASGNSRGLNSKAMISGNGRYVAFTNEPLSDATTLDARNIYVHDLKTGENLRASQASDGTPQSFSAASCQIGTIPVCGSNIGFGSAISDNGRHVTFASDATNLVPNDTNFGSIDNTQGADIFVHDLDTRRTERVSVDSYGRERREAVTVFSATISGTGRHVAYYSD